MASRTRPSVGGGIGAALWLVVVAVPIYYLLVPACAVRATTWPTARWPCRTP